MEQFIWYHFELVNSLKTKTINAFKSLILESRFSRVRTILFLHQRGTKVDNYQHETQN